MPHVPGDDEDTKDFHHDEWLVPTPGSELATLAEEAFVATEGVSPVKGRKPRSDALQRRRLIVANLIANLAAVALRDAPGARLAVSAKNEALTRYARRSFPREVISKSVAALTAAQITRHKIGKRGLSRTVLTPTPALHRRLQCIDPSDLMRAPGAETIVLRARTDERQRGGRNRKVLIDYTDTDETNAMRWEMEAINEALASGEITFANSRLLPFHLFRSFVIASDSAPPSFDQHGRIFGGPSISMARADRHRLRIGGEPLADLDFTGMFVQLAYLTARLPLPSGDPYAGVAGLTDERSACDGGSGREIVKRALAALLCRSGPMRRLPPEIKRRLGPDWTGGQLSAALAARHPGIAHLFGTDIGVRLMFTESRILVRTLLDLIGHGVTALPVHDGIMVPVSMTGAALDAMRRAAVTTLGVILPVKAAALGNNSPPMPSAPLLSACL